MTQLAKNFSANRKASALRSVSRRSDGLGLGGMLLQIAFAGRIPVLVDVGDAERQYMIRTRSFDRSDVSVRERNCRIFSIRVFWLKTRSFKSHCMR